ncbi:MAG: hypothetical protein LBF68_06480 [Christensenellaceae bacterium]|jgi:hypothetical protein|nr:hypothetical protein [Christensenellaceae bacterium]
MRKRLIINVQRFMEDWKYRDNSINVLDNYPRYGIFFYWNGKIYSKSEPFDYEQVGNPDSRNSIIVGNIIKFMGVLDHASEYDKLGPNPKPEEYDIVPRGRVLINAPKTGGMNSVTILVPKYSEDNDSMIGQIIQQFNLGRLKQISVEDDERELDDGAAHYDVSATAFAIHLWSYIDYLNKTLSKVSDEFINDADGMDKETFRQILINPNPAGELVDTLKYDYLPAITNLEEPTRKILRKVYFELIEMIKDMYNV